MFSIPVVVLLFLFLLRIILGSFNQASWLDAVAHLILPGCLGALVYVWLVESSLLPRLQPKSMVLIIMLLGVGLEVGWEITEYVVDLTLHLGWQLGNADTMGDLILGAIGSILGGLVFLKFYRKPIA